MNNAVTFIELSRRFLKYFNVGDVFRVRIEMYFVLLYKWVKSYEIVLRIFSVVIFQFKYLML
jgi:hypothetical protein